MSEVQCLSPPTSSFARIFSVIKGFDNGVSHFSLRQDLQFLCTESMAALWSRDRILPFFSSSNSITSYYIESFGVALLNYSAFAKSCHLIQKRIMKHSFFISGVYEHVSLISTHSHFDTSSICVRA